MIEKLTKAAEASHDLPVKDTERYDPDRRIEYPHDLPVKDTKRYDPDRRIEYPHDLPVKDTEHYDPDRRIEYPHDLPVKDTERYDPDRRIEYPHDLPVKDTERYDPDRRIEYPQGLQAKDTERYDPDKRIEQRCDNTDNKTSEQPDNTVEHEEKKDDNGVVYSVDGVLQPNTHYELNGYRYTTDDKGRIIRTEGEIKIPTEKTPRPRLPDIPDRNETDDRGHVIAREFGGADTEGNLVPMDSEVNQNGEYRKLEQELKKEAQNGSEVKVVIEPQYEGDSHRPTEFIVTYTIDGEVSEKVIINRSNTHV